MDKSTGTNFREISPGSFIYALDQSLSNSACDEMIARFENSPQQQYEGRIGQAVMGDPETSSVSKLTEPFFVIKAPTKRYRNYGER